MRVILQMALLLSLEIKKPVVKMARMAGQFAKPRSEVLELQRGVELLSYRGDIINDVHFQPDKRTPDP